MPLDPDRQEVVRRAADAQLEAYSEVGKSIVNVWRARLELALTLDDEVTIRDILMNPGGETGLWDTNTNCGAGCGGGGTAGW